MVASSWDQSNLCTDHLRAGSQCTFKLVAFASILGSADGCSGKGVLGDCPDCEPLTLIKSATEPVKAVGFGL
jgi:hypothetical protein